MKQASHQSHPRPRVSEFRFYEELNDHLPRGQRKRSFAYGFFDEPSIEDAIGAIGVPRDEIDLILVDGSPVEFRHRLRGGERVTVYPQFERFDISPLCRLRERPLRRPRFVTDTPLGELTRCLRMAGFDVLHNENKDPAVITELSVRERRTILTRDKGLLEQAGVTRGYWVRQTRPEAQLREVVGAFDLTGQLSDGGRCTTCNEALTPADRRCPRCGRSTLRRDRNY